jgi:phosphoribosyl 1,2-cyclic phosphodiesterase
MLHLAVLGSGSSGNSALVCDEDTRILVDAGLSARQICERLNALGIEPDSLGAIILTHEHGDHTRGLEVFCRKRAIPVYATIHTAAIVREGVGQNLTWRQFEAGNSFRIGGLEIHSFPVPHDAVDPVGFRIEAGRTSLGLLSDVGHVTRLILDRLQGVDTLFAEANYDEVLLMNDTKRPWSTKQRISNRHGHLSNDQAAELVATIAGPNLHRVVLGHLSSDCNQPELAVATVSRLLQAKGLTGVEVACAPRHAATALLPVSRASVGTDAAGVTVYEEIPADSLRVCESTRATAVSSAPPVSPASEWSQTEWAF